MNESGTIKSFDGLKLFFQKQGCGPAVLMVHGACVDSDCFEPLAALLEKRCTVYRYDRAGYGRSESREDRDSLLANARDLLEILRQIGPPVRVIAHSAGGAVAMKLAEIQPNAMSALLVFEPLIIRDLIQDADRRVQFQEISDLIQRTQNIYSKTEIFLNRYREIEKIIAKYKIKYNQTNLIEELFGSAYTHLEYVDPFKTEA